MDTPHPRRPPLTPAELDKLERMARQQERHLRFARHSPREERWIPFVNDMGTPVSPAEAVVWVAVCALLMFLAFVVLGLQP